MKGLVALSLGVLLADMTAGVLYCCYSQWMTDWEYAERRGAEIDAAVRRSQWRVEGKLRVCRELRDGRLSLAEAAAWFRAAAGAAAGSDAEGSEAERLCRQVIDFVEVVFPDGPDGPDGPTARALRARLTAELQSLLDTPGTLRLPELATPAL
jgi:hypothetical protein